MESNQITYLEYYNKYKSDRDHLNNALKYLIDYNLQSKKFGNDKLETDLNLQMETYQPTFFVPSMIYTFMYAAPDRQEVNGTTFIDNIPLILVLDFTDSTILGLNFNFIPPPYRAAVLDILNETNKQFYCDVMGNDTFQINKNLCAAISTESNRTKFINILNKKLTSNITAAYRTYKLKYCQNIRLIEYDMWKYIPLLNFGNSIRECNLENLQKSVLKK